MIPGMRTYTTVQVAKMLRVSRDSLYRWMRSGQIKGSRVITIGSGAEYRMWTDREVAAIRRFMQKSYTRGQKKRST